MAIHPFHIHIPGEQIEYLQRRIRSTRWPSLETGELLLQLAAHLTYHLGQISYHRRLVTGNSAGVVGALDSGKFATIAPTTVP